MQIFFKTSKVGEIRSYLSYFAHIFKEMISGRSSVNLTELRPPGFKKNGY